ncbi:uncharacterized protein LOC125492556 [Beta vulgaris subsp. vulgaris]|uniref:uncharacterized protein LOC125492556 n=1 Tax=Beta vulgaris subsp. vulgaris TaxID=3555 RepID=UPI002037175E|nr:uncharacterized protein LOC125492556 [Beta vulgaris subsp. vulgaris]
MGNLYQNLCPSWCFTTNSSTVDKGRIVLAWLPSAFSVDVVFMSTQMIHCRVSPMGHLPSFFCSFVFGSNDRNEREELWEALRRHRTTEPWVILGDFNVVVNLDERIGSTVRLHEVQGFRDCVQFCGVNDIKQAGRFFTWNSKQEGFQRVFSKIDRVMANNEWLEAFENGLVTYLPDGEYDHCPGVLCIHKESSRKKPFRFFNMWVYGDGFMEFVKDVWQRPVNGCKMFQVTQKLKIMKAELKKFNREGFSDIQAQAHHAYNQMIMKQNIAHEQLREVASIEEERKATEDSKRAQARYLSFLKQKAKERWIEKGDDNTKLFHQSIKARRQQNKIYAILDNEGQWLNEEHQIKEAFVSFYDGKLGTKMGERCTIHQQIIRHYYKYVQKYHL